MSSLAAELKKIDDLTPQQKRWFDLICIGRGKKVPVKVGNALVEKGLAVRIFGGYDVYSYWVHYAWCSHCSRQIGMEVED